MDKAGPSKAAGVARGQSVLTPKVGAPMVVVLGPISGTGLRGHPPPSPVTRGEADLITEEAEPDGQAPQQLLGPVCHTGDRGQTGGETTVGPGLLPGAVREGRQAGRRALGRAGVVGPLLIGNPCPHRCDESCLSCEGSSRNCSRCKVGFTQLGTSCITNHTCSNGEWAWVGPKPFSCPAKEKGREGQGPQAVPGVPLPSRPLTLIREDPSCHPATAGQSNE